MTDALRPSPQLLEKLAGIVHTALHELHGVGTSTEQLCRDAEVIAWAKAMHAIGLMPEPKVGQ